MSPTDHRARRVSIGMKGCEPSTSRYRIVRPSRAELHPEFARTAVNYKLPQRNQSAIDALRIGPDSGVMARPKALASLRGISAQLIAMALK
jgi:hypothetical protein